MPSAVWQIAKYMQAVTGRKNVIETESAARSQYWYTFGIAMVDGCLGYDTQDESPFSTRNLGMPFREQCSTMYQI